MIKLISEFTHSLGFFRTETGIWWQIHLCKKGIACETLEIVCLKISVFLRVLQSTFDSRKAMEEGKITPAFGVAEAYDNCKKEEQKILDKLENYRIEMGQKFRCNVSVERFLDWQLLDRFSWFCRFSFFIKHETDFNWKSRRIVLQRCRTILN